MVCAFVNPAVRACGQLRIRASTQWTAGVCVCMHSHTCGECRHSGPLVYAHVRTYQRMLFALTHKHTHTHTLTHSQSHTFTHRCGNHLPWNDIESVDTFFDVFVHKQINSVFVNVYVDTEVIERDGISPGGSLPP